MPEVPTPSTAPPVRPRRPVPLGTRWPRIGLDTRPGHWLGVVVLIVAGAWLGELLGEHEAWINLRYRIHSYLAHSPRPAYPRFSALVLIGDDEYWQGPLARRVPTKRRYLADLLRLLNQAGPAVIALDFDFRSPTPDGSIRDNSDYTGETRDFLSAVSSVAPTTPVVLPRTLGFDHGYQTESDIYEHYPFPTGNVFTGYIALPYDLRQVPFPLPLRDLKCQPGQCAEGHCSQHRCWEDSFAVAIVRASGDTRALRVTQHNETLPYGTFIRPGELQTYSAGDILRRWSPSQLKQNLAHKIVIVGAAWSRFANGRGGPVDSYFSPIGTASGVFLHANYVEAIKDSRVVPPIRHWAAIAIEVALSLALALMFSFTIRTRYKAIGVVTLCILVIALAYFSWQNLGLFFDFLIPMILLVAKGAYEQVRAWQKGARELAHLQTHSR